MEEMPEVVRDIFERGIDIIVDATPEEVVSFIANSDPEVFHNARNKIVLAKQARLLQTLLRDADTSITDDVEVSDG